MEKIGIFGGSFDPPHIGHLNAARYAMQALQLDRVLWIPCSRNPGKEKPFLGASNAQRLQMLSILLQGESCMEICSWELEQGGESYTGKTVAYLKACYPDAELTLLLGTDMFLGADRWKDAAQFLPGLKLAVLSREMNTQCDTMDAQKERLEAMGAAVNRLSNPVNAISSTQLRRLLAFEAADTLLPEALTAYIRQQNLYGVGLDWKHLPMEQLEPIVVALLHPNRVRHVLGVRDTAAAMAGYWNTDETDAARAGLLHDITKALDGPLQLTICEAYGKILSDFSRKYPKTLHALTGSLVAERIFGENSAVVSAIECHTTGKADMNPLEKIIYIADYMEPNRDFPGVEALRDLAFRDLDGALKLGLEMTLEHLQHQGNEVSPESREALEYLNRNR